MFDCTFSLQLVTGSTITMVKDYTDKKWHAPETSSQNCQKKRIHLKTVAKTATVCPLCHRWCLYSCQVHILDYVWPLPRHNPTSYHHMKTHHLPPKSPKDAWIVPKIVVWAVFEGWMLVLIISLRPFRYALPLFQHQIKESPVIHYASNVDDVWKWA